MTKELFYCVLSLREKKKRETLRWSRGKATYETSFRNKVFSHFFSTPNIGHHDKSFLTLNNFWKGLPHSLWKTRAQEFRQLFFLNGIDSHFWLERNIKSNAGRIQFLNSILASSVAQGRKKEILSLPGNQPALLCLHCQERYFIYTE